MWILCSHYGKKLAHLNPHYDMQVWFEDLSLLFLEFLWCSSR